MKNFIKIRARPTEVLFLCTNLTKERKTKMMREFIMLLSNNMFFRIVMIEVCLDTILGSCRAIKEHKFNSCVGIDGAIRKVAMLISICFLMGIDMIAHINVLSLVPQQYVQFLGVEKLGLSEFLHLWTDYMRQSVF